ncbi:MAG: hypothetical protein H6Q90_617 [Deltaproteobacteria bacterium]|nr:hypothetical protein [Deltaproteobacteria bacterium]
MLGVLAVLGCGEAPPRPSPPVPLTDETRGCGQAAAGIERGTRGVRGPGETVLEAMKTRCTQDTWSPPAIDCFATMTEDDLGRCAGLLEPRDRERMFATLGGGIDDRTSIAIAAARLSSLQVGIAECDQFVAMVATVLGCEQMPLDARLRLGNETADFWSLPTDRLSADALRRMAAVCGRSLAELTQNATAAGCKP